MDTYYKFITPIILMALPALIFSQTNKTWVEYNVTYIIKDYKPTKKTRTEKSGYEKYDNKGNVIEEGEYGEIKHFSSVTKNADSTITVTTGHGRNYDNLNTVQFNKYDTANRLVEDELWQYFNNQKSYLVYRTIYDYNNNGQLIKETEFNKDVKISRIKTYHINGNIIASIDTVYNFTYEGITRVDGESRDTTYLDSLKRPKEVIHFFKGKFLYRQVYLYDKFGLSKTELRYDDKPDNLWVLTEWQYDLNKKLKRRLWKIIGSGNEARENYLYNELGNLEKILHYSVDDLTGYTKYVYKESN